MKRQWSKPVLKPMTAEDVAWFENVMQEAEANEQANKVETSKPSVTLEARRVRKSEQLKAAPIEESTKAAADWINKIRLETKKD